MEPEPGQAMGKNLGGGGVGGHKGLLWRLPEVTSKELGKIGPGLGIGIGCGAGAGIGFFGGTHHISRVSCKIPTFVVRIMN